MKKIAAALMLMFTFVSVADAKSRVSSSRSSYKPSVSRAYTAPKKTASYNGGSFFSSKTTAPKATAPSLNLSKPAVQSKPTLKSLGFSKPKATVAPAFTQTVKKPSVSGSYKPRVSSTPTRTVVTRKATPTRYVASPTRRTVVQRNYYNNYGGYNGYNRGYSGGHYGGNYGSSGMGTSMLGGALGAFGGMMLYDALTDNSAEKALQAQVNQLQASQQATNNAMLQMAVSQNGAPVVQPQCFLPPDAPLMMNPAFYCQPQNNR